MKLWSRQEEELQNACQKAGRHSVSNSCHAWQLQTEQRWRSELLQCVFAHMQIWVWRRMANLVLRWWVYCAGSGERSRCGILEFESGPHRAILPLWAGWISRSAPRGVVIDRRRGWWRWRDSRAWRRCMVGRWRRRDSVVRGCFEGPGCGCRGDCYEGDGIWELRWELFERGLGANYRRPLSLRAVVGFGRSWLGYSGV